ncbi:MAG: lysine biosynthesis protein LysW [Chloroflexota bacterium]
MTVECPECAAAITLNNPVKGEILRCAECGADLELVSLEPLTLALAPTEEEDWGE